MVLPGCDIAFGGILVKCVVTFLASMYEQISFVNRLHYKGENEQWQVVFLCKKDTKHEEVYISIAPASGMGR